jgi:hypothetical protein
VGGVRGGSQVFWFVISCVLGAVAFGGLGRFEGLKVQQVV